MTFGEGNYHYELVPDWPKFPKQWHWGWIPGVACDSQGRVFVYSRSDKKLALFDENGAFMTTWGDESLPDAHGIYIDADDNVYCTDHTQHCVYKFDPEGKLAWVLGTPGKPDLNGGPFNQPTDFALASDGSFFISDGYGNSRVHKFSPEREHLLSWGESGEGPGQFNLPHCVRVDRHDRVWVCDRENHRIQIFDLDGNYVREWSNLLRPAALVFDPCEDVVYIAELDCQVSIYTLDGQQLAKWGGGHKSEQPGMFSAYPHGIWVTARGDLYVSEVGKDQRLQKFRRK